MDALANLIIRPKRAQYNPNKDLGPKQFLLNGKQMQRIDFEITNDFSLKLKCSLFTPIILKAKLPCVIYCHGNEGSRVEALEVVELLLPHDIIVAAFDFSGSGLSEGNYVTLGFNEKDDLKCVVSHLQTLSYISDIGIWGRSMGAATSILYASNDPSIVAMTIDSSFSSLPQLCTDMLKSRTLGKLLGGMFLGSVRKTIKKKANFELEDISPVERISHCKMPALFIHGTKDSVVPIGHSRKLFNEYLGSSKIHELDLEHTEPRPRFIKTEIRTFFTHKFTEAKKRREFNEKMSAVLSTKLGQNNIETARLEEFFTKITYGSPSVSDNNLDFERSFIQTTKAKNNQQPADISFDQIYDSKHKTSPPFGANTEISNGKRMIMLMKNRQKMRHIDDSFEDSIGDKNGLTQCPSLDHTLTSRGEFLKTCGDESFAEVPRGYHSKMISVNYFSEAD